MPGYNHYPSCECGWCVNRRGVFDREELHREMVRRTAENFLRKNGAIRLGISCFVDPNATCPVCKAGVFFYANSNGSRVFFNDLAPTWSKHECTDRRHDAARISQTANRPERRKLGLIKEIVEQARLLDRKKAPDINRTDRPNPDSWRLLVITNTKERGTSIEIEADFVETVHQHHITLTTAVGPIFYIGQFVSICCDVLCLLDEALGKRIDVNVSYVGVKPFSHETPRRDGRNGAEPNLDEFGIPIGLMTEGLPGQSQRSHYVGYGRSSNFFGQVKTLVLATAKDGAKYLADFLIALSDSKVQTLRSSGWTRDIVSGLIYDIRNGGNLLPEPQVDRENVAAVLREVEGRISDLEAAWDNALTSVERQKVRDQLDAARKKRTKLRGTGLTTRT